MRYALLLLLAPALLATGCSMMLAEAGTRYSEFDTREKAHKLFGKPINSGSIEGHQFEEFFTRRKFSDGGGLEDLARFICTLGLNELYLFPTELFRVTRSTVLGQTIRITYEEDGCIKTYDIALGKPTVRQTGNEDTPLPSPNSP